MFQVAVRSSLVAIGMTLAFSMPSIAADDIASSNPLSGDAAAIEQGKTIYSEHCTLCHGRKANGKTGRWQSADLTKFNKGFREFVTIVQNGIKPRRGSNNKMPPWAEFLNEEQITMIGAYLETLSGRKAKWTDPE